MRRLLMFITSWTIALTLLALCGDNERATSPVREGGLGDMCLTKVTEQRAPNQEEVVAWKVGRLGVEGKIFQTSPLGAIIPVGRWYSVKEDLLSDGRHIGPLFKYQCGFHAFAYEEDAEAYRRRETITSGLGSLRYKVVRVRLRDVRTVGTQDGMKVYVAQEILVEEAPGTEGAGCDKCGQSFSVHNDDGSCVVCCDADCPVHQSRGRVK